MEEEVSMLEERLGVIASILDATTAKEVRETGATILGEETVARFDTMVLTEEDDLSVAATNAALQLSEVVSAALGLVQHARSVVRAAPEDAAPSPEFQGSVRAAHSMWGGRRMRPDVGHAHREIVEICGNWKGCVLSGKGLCHCVFLVQLEEAFGKVEEVVKLKLRVAVADRCLGIVESLVHLLNVAEQQLDECFAVARARSGGEEVVGGGEGEGMAVEGQLHRAAQLVVDAASANSEAHRKAALLGGMELPGMEKGSGGTVSMREAQVATNRADERVRGVRQLIGGIHRLILSFDHSSSPQPPSPPESSMTMTMTMSGPFEHTSVPVSTTGFSTPSQHPPTHHPSSIPLSPSIPPTIRPPPPPSYSMHPVAASMERAQLERLPRKEKRRMMWEAVGVKLTSPQLVEQKKKIVGAAKRRRSLAYRAWAMQSAGIGVSAEAERLRAKEARQRNIEQLAKDPGLGTRTSLWVGEGHTSRWATSLRGDPPTRRSRSVIVPRRKSVRLPRSPRKLEWQPGVYRPHGGLGFGSGYEEYGFDGHRRRHSSASSRSRTRTRSASTGRSRTSSAMDESKREDEDEMDEEDQEEDAVRHAFEGARARRGTAVPKLRKGALDLELASPPNDDGDHDDEVGKEDDGGGAMKQLRVAMDAVRERHRSLSRSERLKEQQERFRSRAGKLYDEKAEERHEKIVAKHKLKQRRRTAWSSILGSPIASSPTGEQVDTWKRGRRSGKTSTKRREGKGRRAQSAQRRRQPRSSQEGPRRSASVGRKPGDGMRLFAGILAPSSGRKANNNPLSTKERVKVTPPSLRHVGRPRRRSSTHSHHSTASSTHRSLHKEGPSAAPITTPESKPPSPPPPPSESSKASVPKAIAEEELGPSDAEVMATIEEIIATDAARQK